jgi:sigma-B regulation protein RsbU (phosphoserine phosphatase)
MKTNHSTLSPEPNLEVAHEALSIQTPTSNQVRILHVIKESVPENPYPGSGIGKLVKGFKTVSETVKVKDLALELPVVESTPCFAVLNHSEEALGIIIKRDFQSELVKLYWKDINQNSPLSKLMTLTKSFDVSTNILVVAEELQNELASQKIKYYLCHRMDKDVKKFYGLFSSLDLFQHITEISSKDMELASLLASRVTPDSVIEVTEDVRIFGSARMARGVGGDYYSVRYLDDKKLLLSLCDVSGKGVSASLVATLIAGMVQVFDFNRGRLGIFLEQLNEFLLDTFDREKFVTGIFVELSQETGALTMYDYGHSHVFLHRKTHFHRIKTGDEHPPLGIQYDGVIHANHFQLEPGDTLLLLSDGILEQTNDQNEEYGIKRVADWIHRAKKNNQMATVGKSIIDDVHAFKQSQPQMDDQTLSRLNSNKESHDLYSYQR